MWILLLFVHVGFMGNTDSNAITTADGFTSEATCKAAGNKAKELVKGTKKELTFVCVSKYS